MNSDKKLVCLGGGIGTVNLIKGLKSYTPNITVVVSMADEGGSSGRLRRLYHILPPGDLVSCMSALSKETNPLLSKLLTFRFPGDRYGDDMHLGGHKLGNLIMAALFQITGSFEEAVRQFRRIFDIPGSFLSATKENVTISAITKDGKEIFGEENIDLGKYNGKRVLEKVILHPKNAKAGAGVIECIKKADVVIAGPGDLYTTVLPVLIVPEIKQALVECSKEKIFVVNVANKPFETKGYGIYDYITAIEKHLGVFPFQKVIINNNFSLSIPKKYHYEYVRLTSKKDYKMDTIIQDDLVNDSFPLYHDPAKLAKVIWKTI